MFSVVALKMQHFSSNLIIFLLHSLLHFLPHQTLILLIKNRLLSDIVFCLPDCITCKFHTQNQQNLNTDIFFQAVFYLFLLFSSIISSSTILCHSFSVLRLAFSLCIASYSVDMLYPQTYEYISINLR